MNDALPLIDDYPWGEYSDAEVAQLLKNLRQDHWGQLLPVELQILTDAISRLEASS